MVLFASQGISFLFIPFFFIPVNKSSDTSHLLFSRVISFLSGNAVTIYELTPLSRFRLPSNHGVNQIVNCFVSQDFIPILTSFEDVMSIRKGIDRKESDDIHPFHVSLFPVTFFSPQMQVEVKAFGTPVFNLRQFPTSFKKAA